MRRVGWEVWWKEYVEWSFCDHTKCHSYPHSCQTQFLIICCLVLVGEPLCSWEWNTLCMLFLVLGWVLWGSTVRKQSAFVWHVLLGLILLFQEGNCVPLIGYPSQSTNNPSSPHCSLQVADWLAFLLGISIFHLYNCFPLWGVLRRCGFSLFCSCLQIIKVPVNASC